MEFKEFFELEEVADNICSENIITSPIKFASGVGGNLIGQNLRGAGNILKGAAKGISGVANAGVGSLQALSGNGKERLYKGLKSIGGGIKDASSGAVQMAASPVSSLLRGAQAVDDKKIGGILKPTGGNKVQSFFGLSGKEEPVADMKAKEEDGAKEIDKVRKKPLTIADIKTKKREDGAKEIDKASEKKKAERNFYKLIDAIRSANGAKRTVLVQKLKNNYPDLYQQLVVNNRRKSRPSTDPAGRLRQIQSPYKSFELK